jgi:hypothetical protein
MWLLFIICPSDHGRVNSPGSTVTSGRRQESSRKPRTPLSAGDPVTVTDFAEAVFV